MDLSLYLRYQALYRQQKIGKIWPGEHAHEWRISEPPCHTYESAHLCSHQELCELIASLDGGEVEKVVRKGPQSARYDYPETQQVWKRRY